MTQRDTVLRELTEKEWFALSDALSLSPPIYRLSERVRELIKEGYTIQSRKKAGKPYQEYKLIPNQ